MSRGMTTEMPDLDPRWDAEADLIVVGSGVAGLTAALEARALGLRVLVVSKDAMEESNTRWAQGGVAVVLPEEHEPGDSVAAHIEDTITAGAGLCDADAVRAIVADGPANQIKSAVDVKHVTATVPGVDLQTLRTLPGVTELETRGETVVLSCNDSDSALRALLAGFPQARDILVTGAGLEAAFVQLTGDVDDDADVTPEGAQA